MDILKTIGKNIRNFRQFRNLTQRQLAEKLCVSITALAYWERGTHTLDVRSLQKLCNALEITPNQLCGWEENEELNDFLKKQEELLEKKNQIQSEINRMQLAYSELNKEIKK